MWRFKIQIKEVRGQSRKIKSRVFYSSIYYYLGLLPSNIYILTTKTYNQ